MERNSLEGDVTSTGTSDARVDGLILHGAASHYDRLAWLLTLGRERTLRERMVDVAGVAAGDTVLDVGCGTGALALVAGRRVGATGMVHGVDASPEMIAHATRRTAAAGLPVAFQVAPAQALPFPDAHFDVVLCTLVLHHLPGPSRERSVREMRRVLRPGGRVLAVDFGAPSRRGGTVFSRLHRHGGVPLDRIVALLGGAGLRVAERGSLGLADLQFAVGQVPNAHGDAQAAAAEAHRALPPLPLPRWLVPAAVGTVVAAHALAFGLAGSALGASALVAAGGVAAAVGAHGGLALLAHRVRGRR